MLDDLHECQDGTGTMSGTRVLVGPHDASRHLSSDEAGCPGCVECPEVHCRSCGFRHLDAQHERICPVCVGRVREDMREIVKIIGRPMAVEAEVKGIRSEAAMLVGPSADPAAWERRAEIARSGARFQVGRHVKDCPGWTDDAPRVENDAQRITRRPCEGCLPAVDAGYLDDNLDELHPVYVLGAWEQAWRTKLGHEATYAVPVDAATAVSTLTTYLEAQMTYMAQRAEPDFVPFARDVRSCRTHLEAVLHDQRRPETGAPCPICTTPEKPGPGLVKHHDTEDEGTDFEVGRLAKTYDDRWTCTRCGQWWSEKDYRMKVAAAYVLHSPALTDTDLQSVYRVAPGSVRRWASEGKVHRRGKNADGRTLYDVAEVLATRDRKPD